MTKIWPFHNMNIGRLDVDIVIQISYETTKKPGLSVISLCFYGLTKDEIRGIVYDYEVSLVTSPKVGNIIKVSYLGAYKSMFPPFRE